MIKVFIYSAALFISFYSSGQHNTEMDSLIRAVNLMKDDSVKFYKYLNIGVRLKDHFPDSAEYYTRKAGELAVRINSKSCLGVSLLNLCSIQAERGNFKEALKNCDSAAFYLRKNESDYPVDLRQIKGNIYLSIGEFDSAASNYFKVLKAREITNDQGLGSTYNNLCELFNSVNKYEEALKYAIKQYLWALKLKNNDEIAWAEINIIESYNGLDRSRDARKYALDLYMLSKKSNDPYIKLYSIREMGTVYFNEGDYRRALHFYTTALNGSDNLFEKLSVCKLLNDVARTHLAMNHFEDAIKYLQRSLKLAKEINARNVLLETYNLLAENYAAKKNFVMAYNYYKLYKQLGDSLLNEKSVANLQDLTTRFELAKKEDKIELLKIENQLQQAESGKQRVQKAYVFVFLLIAILISWVLFYVFRNRITKRHLSERARISRDLHDDVGATLSSISIFSEAAKQKLNNKNTPEVVNLLERISNDAREMVSVMSDFVWSLNPVNDSIEKLTDRMQSFASTVLSVKNIRMNFETDASLKSFSMRPEVRKNIFLIFKEAINNISKYSEASDVLIQMHAKNNAFKMIISDNGHGFEISQDSKGNGLYNMKERAKEMNGRLTFHSDNKGTNISLTLISP